MKNIEYTRKAYYHLQESPDGRFSLDNTILLIDVNTTAEERIEIANNFTNGGFFEYPGFYQITEVRVTPVIATINYL